MFRPRNPLPTVLSLLTSLSLWAVVMTSHAPLASAQGVDCEQPNVLFVIDYSGSMNRDNKWNIAVESLTQVTIAFDNRLRFGIMHFPTNGNCRVDQSAVWSSVMQNGGAAVRQSLQGRRPDGNTPLASAVQEAARYYDQLNDRNRKNIIVVISDGGESCGGNPVNATSDAFNRGYTTYVIGFGSGVDGGTLRRMAEVGGTQQYYQANDAAQLFSALQTVANQATNEVCDGTDNDCDGFIDEQIAPVPCDSECGLGEKLCLDGQLTPCAGGQIPQESCDGQDNDCDGTIDEIVAVPCETPSGQPGTADCLPSGEVGEMCTPDNPDREEICDGADNDVDGVVDEDTASECNNECHLGRVLCVEGSLTVCTAAPVTEEICNGFDDDCDGNIDEMAMCVGAEICGEEGACLQPCPNGECPSGFSCESDAYCHPLPCSPSCDEGFRCVKQACVFPCTVDSQCAGLQMICDPEQRRCVEDPANPIPSGGGGSISGPTELTGGSAAPANTGGTEPSAEPASVSGGASCATQPHSPSPNPLLLALMALAGLALRRTAQRSTHHAELTKR